MSSGWSRISAPWRRDPVVWLVQATASVTRWSTCRGRCVRTSGLPDARSRRLPSTRIARAQRNGCSCELHCPARDLRGPARGLGSQWLEAANRTVAVLAPRWGRSPTMIRDRTAVPASHVATCPGATALSSWPPTRTCRSRRHGRRRLAPARPDIPHRDRVVMRECKTAAHPPPEARRQSSPVAQVPLISRCWAPGGRSSWWRLCLRRSSEACRPSRLSCTRGSDDPAPGFPRDSVAESCRRGPGREWEPTPAPRAHGARTGVVSDAYRGRTVKAADERASIRCRRRPPPFDLSRARATATAAARLWPAKPPPLCKHGSTSRRATDTIGAAERHGRVIAIDRFSTKTSSTRPSSRG